MIRSVRRADSEPRFEAWLKLVVQTAAYDLLRAERRRAVRESAVCRAGRPPGGTGKDLSADDEQVEWLRLRIAELEPQVSRMMKLRFQYRWTLGRIGRLLGLSVGAVDGRIRRALGAIRRRAREDLDA